MAKSDNFKDHVKMAEESIVVRLCIYIYLTYRY